MAKKVIVIDDSEVIRQQVGALLRKAGYEMVEAADGQKGLEVIRATEGAVMVICDVNMPVMNGLEMAEAMRREPRAEGLPMVMLTTEVQKELVLRARQAGVKGWLVKPFKEEALISTVVKLAGPA